MYMLALTAMAHECSNFISNRLTITYVNEQKPIQRCYEAYTAFQSIEHKHPLWTSYMLTREMVAAPDVPRTNNFTRDLGLSGKYQSTNAAYAKTPYDRGHMVPYTDINITPNAAKESFYFTNIVPQYAWFNRGIWKQLETAVRNSVARYGTAYVATGVYYDLGNHDILDDGTGVPSYFWKIIIYPSSNVYSIYVVPHSSGTRQSKLVEFCAHHTLFNNIFNRIHINSSAFDGLTKICF